MSKKVLIFPQCVPASKEETQCTYRKQLQVDTAQPKETWLRPESVKAHSCKSDGIKVQLICKRFWKLLPCENLSSWQVQQVLYSLQKILKATLWVSFCLVGLGLDCFVLPLSTLPSLSKHRHLYLILLELFTNWKAKRLKRTFISLDIFKCIAEITVTKISKFIFSNAISKNSFEEDFFF